jgi:hypothetical protein
MTTFTDKEKLDELTREIEMRRRVYRWQVRNGKLSEEQAQRQINLMIAIKMDYSAKIEAAKLKQMELL